MKKNSLYKFFALIITSILLVSLVMMLRGNSSVSTTSTTQQELQLLRDALSTKKNTLRVNLLRSLDPQVKNTQGNILWNHETQSGILQMQGLPGQEQREKYQLWIYDLKRDHQHPVLAANFYGNKSGNANYLVAIKPTEIIDKAFKFVVTKSLISNNSFENANPLLFAQP